MGRGTSGSNPTARSQKGSKMSYLSFVKERPVLYGNIVVNGVGKFGMFRSTYNPLTNKDEYQYFTLKGKKGTGGFTMDKAYSLYKNKKLTRSKDDWII
jgi:hypothetical protein|nr:MAG TPA: hypothetical protein [Caudoviricetes sp.]